MYPLGLAALAAASTTAPTASSVPAEAAALLPDGLVIQYDIILTAATMNARAPAVTGGS